MTHIQSYVARSSRAVAALAALTALIIAARPALTGRLVAHFHVTKEVAGTIVTLIVSGGWELDLLFPWIIPVEATVAGLIAVAGTAYAIAW